MGPDLPYVHGPPTNGARRVRGALRDENALLWRCSDDDAAEDIALKLVGDLLGAEYATSTALSPCARCASSTWRRIRAEVAGRVGGHINIPILYFTQLMGLAFGLPEEDIRLKSQPERRREPLVTDGCGSDWSGTAVSQLTGPEVSHMAKDGPVRIGVYVCHCGSNIAGTVDVFDTAAYAATLPHVAVARRVQVHVLLHRPGDDQARHRRVRPEPGGRRCLVRHVCTSRRFGMRLSKAA